MKLKRWAIYDGIAGDYYYKRFFFKQNAEAEINAIIFHYTMDLIGQDEDQHLTLEELESIVLVELE